MELAELPCPRPMRGQVLIKTRASLISAGTERMLVEFSQANLIQKARQQPDKVKQVLDKMRTDGLMPTLEAVFRKLDEPLPLGYCNVGTVLEVGAGVHDLAPGERVASNGSHAEVVCVPRHLCAKVPEGVGDEAAAFTVLGSIALQGVRLAVPTLGERFVVFGMGLLGLLTVQLLRASGCEVLAVDLSEERLALAGGPWRADSQYRPRRRSHCGRERLDRRRGRGRGHHHGFGQVRCDRASSGRIMPQARPNHPCRCGRPQSAAR